MLVETYFYKNEQGFLYEIVKNYVSYLHFSFFFYILNNILNVVTTSGAP